MGWLIVVLLLPLALAEIGELSPWLARRCIRGGTRMLSSNRARERFVEEWCAGVDRVPGKLTKLCFAAGIVMIAVPILRVRDWRTDREVPGMRMACERAIAALDDADCLDTLVELIAYTGSVVLGFRDVAVNLEQPDGSLRVVAVRGPAEARELLLGKSVPRVVMERVLLEAQQWGTLRFVTSFEVFEDSGVAVYVGPAGGGRPGPDRWDPAWGLFAPLYAPDGRMMGEISLDAPASDRCPGPAQRALLEKCAARAACQLARFMVSGAS